MSMRDACWKLAARALIIAGACTVAQAQLAPPPTGPTLRSQEWAARAPVPGGTYAYKARLLQHVKAKDLGVLHAHLEAGVAELALGKTSDGMVDHVLDMVTSVDESDAGLFDQWVDAYPQSHVGPLARAYFNLHRAWKGRGDRFARATLPSEFDEMHRWLPLVRRDAQLALQREPRCSLCYAVLIQLSMPLNLDKEALDWFKQGLAVNRDSRAVPLAYYTALDPRWGGSIDAQQALADKLRLGGHEAAARRLTAQLRADAIQFRAWHGPKDFAEGLAAAQASLAIDRTYQGAYVAAYALQQSGRHAEAVAAFDAIAHEYDSPVYVFSTRAASHAALGQWPEAMRDLRIAYEQFSSEWAFEVLVRSSNGSGTWKIRTHPDEAGELCREGALRGLPVAMTCLGGMYYFGANGVGKDVTQARQWFRRAADAGNAQGMMDLAHMSTTGEGAAAADRDQAIKLWIAAARKGHPQAQGKLDALDTWERFRYIQWPALVESSRGWARWVARLAEYVFTR